MDDVFTSASMRKNQHQCSKKFAQIINLPVHRLIIPSLVRRHPNFTIGIGSIGICKELVVTGRVLRYTALLRSRQCFYKISVEFNRILIDYSDISHSLYTAIAVYIWGWAPTQSDLECIFQEALRIGTQPNQTYSIFIIRSFSYTLLLISKWGLRIHVYMGCSAFVRLLCTL